MMVADERLGRVGGGQGEEQQPLWRCEDDPGAGRAGRWVHVELSTSRCRWLILMSSSPGSVSTETDHLLCATSPQVLLGAGAAPRLDAHVVFRSHSSDRDRHPLPAARPKGDVVFVFNL